MKKFLMIETACDKRKEALEIAKRLIDDALVASCHIIESDSSWNWLGKKEETKEYLLQVKTEKRMVKKIYDVIKSIHSYDCFEFAIYEIKSINKEYLDWIDGELK